jgi:tagatose-6-phosphate ketose/aldose isomerase
MVDNVADPQGRAGAEHTLREIVQQPELWLTTASQVVSAAKQTAERIRGRKAIILTGSGSSHYVGECIAREIQRGLGCTTLAVGSGELLLLGRELLPVERPMTLVSFARSGNSPESCGLISSLLDAEPEIEHLVITCNPRGRAASEWAAGGDKRVAVQTLDERTCDKSLVMTSSFTSMALAGMGLAHLDRPEIYLRRAEILAEVGREIIEVWSKRIEPIARQGFSRMIALGTGGQFGAARESALKMLEMTDGRVVTLAECWLGFRHGPMCALHDGSLLLVFVSRDASRRAYQLDLLREVRAKGLGGPVIVVGSEIPADLLSDRDLAIDCPGLSELPDEWAAIAGVVVGQLLGLFRCLQEGLQPDEPAATGAINRVVPDFTLYPV